MKDFQSCRMLTLAYNMEDMVRMATVLGFKNNSFSKALQNTPMLGAGFRFDAFVIPLICDTVTHVEKNEFIKN